MIFNAILSVNHIFIIYTQFYNLLFPHRSCSIGLFSVGKHTPSSQTECSHIRPICPHMVRLVGILLNRLFRFGCLFCEPFSVKSGIEPVLLCQSNYTSTFVHIRAARNKTTQKSVRKYKFIKKSVNKIL